MGRSGRQLALFLIAVLFTTSLSAASRAEQIDQLLRKYNTLKQFNGSALVADANGVVLEKGYGFANFEWQIPNTPDTRFRLGSITKQFTSMVIMQLAAEGKIKLDEKLTAYLPDYRKDTGDRVTITHLLNHTSGIPSYTSMPGFFRDKSRDPYEVADFVKKYASGDLEFEPGSKYVYNNSGYFLLGAVIEKVTGKLYAQVLEERIFRPLGMKASGYDVSATIIPKRASGYHFVAGEYANAPYLDMTIPYAAGSLYSTVQDLYVWDRALYGDKLLGESLKKQMWTPGLQNYGFGWVITTSKLDDGKTEVSTVTHGGGIHGFNTLLVRIPEKKELVVLLDNTSRGDKLDAIASGVVSILHGIEPKVPKKSLVEELAALTKDGSGAAIVARYRELKKSHPDAYDFNEQDLNTLGYQLLARGRVEDAIEIFKLNVEMFPQSWNPYDSLAEAYAVKGQKELAIENYRKSIAINPRNDNGRTALERLEKPPAAGQASAPLEAFVGKYELAPGFILSFFVEDEKLMTQATGQQKLGLREDGANAFAVVGVAARVVFEVGADGKATSVTLFQGGREMKAKRIE
jgi:CubicO group peptidase (beta-lactamase class C family)